MSLEQELVKQVNSLQKQVDGLVKPEVSDVNARFERLFGNNIPANSYKFTQRTFQVNDFVNHKAGFEDAQASPYSFGGSPGGFSLTLPASTGAASNFYSHFLTIYNNAGGGTLAYLDWNNATGKTITNLIGSVKAYPTATDDLVAELRLWDATSPGVNTRWWALRFNWLGSTRPQFPMVAGMFYSAAAGDGLTFAYNTGTQSGTYAQINLGSIYRITSTFTAGPTCVIEVYPAEGTLLTSFGATVANMPLVVKCARLYVASLYGWFNLDQVVFS